MSHSTHRKVARVAAVLALTASGLAFGIVHSTPAHADPTFSTALQGVGSDTIQDLFDAYAGSEPFTPSPSTTFYTPLASGFANGASDVTISSWDAVPYNGSASNPGAIITRLGGPSFDRPNGGGAGVQALLASAGYGTNAAGPSYWQASSASATGGAVSITNQIDFARTPSAPTTAGNHLTFIPFGRDGVTYAYYSANSTDSGSGLGTLSSSQLKTLYSNTSTGTITVGSDTVRACLPQPGSGLRKVFESSISVSDGTAGAAATAAGCNGEEVNGGNTFATVASGFGSGVDAVVPFSVGSWIAQANGAAQDRSGTARAAGVALGDPDGIGGGPTTGTAPGLAVNATYDASTQYGYDLFVAVPTNKLSGAFVNKNLVGMFAGSGAAICTTGAQNTLAKFGFASLTSNDLTTPVGGSPTALACGDTTDIGNG